MALYEGERRDPLWLPDRWPPQYSCQESDAHNQGINVEFYERNLMYH